ncbi:MAG TPA: trimethylamine methyltransferase family protein, partial [Armatimonadota bacterium]|nr:trimethylamine methyltransferase family protein [Armatimonadota bacterium]
VAGCATVCIAELLGGWLIGRCLDPEVAGPASVISGSMDMATGKACFASPEAIMQDCITHQFFDRVYGARVGVDSDASYLEANVPGIEAAYERLMKQQAMGAMTGSMALHLGTLDGAAVFSREQAMIDLDVCRALWHLYRGAEITDELMAVEEIERIGHGLQESFFESPHTLAHFRDAFLPAVFRRENYDEVRGTIGSDDEVLRRANERWKRILADHEPTHADEEMVREIEKVVQSAWEHLVG